MERGYGSNQSISGHEDNIEDDEGRNETTSIENEC